MAEQGIDNICIAYHIIRRWVGLLRLTMSLSRSLTNCTRMCGPQLGRPRVDTLNDSRHANMKELRFSAADGEWRVVFAFDTKRKAILLVAGDKSGVSEKRFYRRLIRKADGRFEAHLARLKKEGKQSWL